MEPTLWENQEDDMNARQVWMAAMLLICVAGAATAQTEWVLDPEDPVLEPSPPGSWDVGGRFMEAVIKIGDVYHMYFSGVPEEPRDMIGAAIGHATSADGVRWELDPANPVLRPGAEGEWDQNLWGGATVIHDGSEFRMWYTGESEGDWPLIMRGGYATSSDGSTWAKYPGNPVIEPGPPGSHDERWVVPQTVIFHDGTYCMWYLAAGAQAPLDAQIGYAESDDGLSWIKHPEPVLEPGRGDVGGFFSDLSVVFDGARYHMFYEVFGPGWFFYPAYAFSADGIHWTRYARKRLVRTHFGVFSPAVIWDGDGSAFEMWYTSNPPESHYRARSQCCSTVYSWIIPAAAHGAGAGGAFFQTDVDISNAGGTAAEYRVAWLPRGEDNEEWLWSDLLSLGPGMSVRYPNVLAEVFGLEPDAYGSLVIEASSEDLLAMSRIFNNTWGKAAGSYGQAMPAIRIDDFTAKDERRRILFGTENAEMRFNVGCQSAYEFHLRINLDLFDASGTFLKTETMTLEPWSNRQLDRIFDAYRPVTGYVDVWTDDWALFYCYGSMLDNVTNDPTTILPQ